MNDKPLIIVGASARAAAFSAHRAGYTPYWLDQFGDEDLRQRFPGSVIADYPKAAVELIAGAPEAPFLFTGAMENHPGVLEQLCAQRELLGNPGPACLRVRDPALLYEALRRNNIACPEFRHNGSAAEPRHDWLLKPLRSAGGIGTRRYEGQPVDKRHYLQEYIRGDSFFRGVRGQPGAQPSAGRDPATGRHAWVPCRRVQLLRQHGAPLELSDAEAGQWRRIGEVISGEFGLRGLFGVDAIRRQDSIYPVEANPRYTASVEVLELALGYRAVKFHCDACYSRLPDIEERVAGHLVGKAILFAPVDIIFTGCVEDGFSIADIPAQGTAIRQGQPILTVMVTGSSMSSINKNLKRAARSIYKINGVRLD